MYSILLSANATNADINVIVRTASTKIDGISKHGAMSCNTLY